MSTKKILLEYRVQNPKKYAAKFGTLDPETLDGIIGMTQPTEAELNQGVRPKAIWREYELNELRAMGGVSVIPAQLVTQANHFQPAPVAPAPVVQAAAPVVEEKKEETVVTDTSKTVESELAGSQQV